MLKHNPEHENKIVLLEISEGEKFIDSTRFMSSSLSSLIDNLAEGHNEDKCEDCKSYLEYEEVMVVH